MSLLNSLDNGGEMWFSSLLTHLPCPNFQLQLALMVRCALVSAQSIAQRANSPANPTLTPMAALCPRPVAVEMTLAPGPMTGGVALSHPDPPAMKVKWSVPMGLTTGAATQDSLATQGSPINAQPQPFPLQTFTLVLSLIPPWQQPMHPPQLHQFLQELPVMTNGPRRSARTGRRGGNARGDGWRKIAKALVNFAENWILSIPMHWKTHNWQ